MYYRYSLSITNDLINLPAYTSTPGGRYVIKLRTLGASVYKYTDWWKRRSPKKKKHDKLADPQPSDKHLYFLCKCYQTYYLLAWLGKIWTCSLCKLESFKCRNNVGMSLKQKPGHGKLAVLTGSDELDIHDVIIRSPSVSLGVVV